MANFEVVVEELRSTTQDADDSTNGLLLQQLLERTGGQYVWHFEPPAELRKQWRRTGEVIADANLAEIARAQTIPISLEHLRGKDPATTRVKVRFEISFTSQEGQAAAALDGPQLL